MQKLPEKTLVVVLLDESGSMEQRKGQVIVGFNEYVNTLRRQLYRRALFTLIKFSSAQGVRVHSNAIGIGRAPILDTRNYKPNGGTPLYDAIGHALSLTERKAEELKEKYSLKVIFVIQTDGEENSSREYDSNAINALITAYRHAGWAFAFLGADQDAWKQASQLGFSRGSTLSYASSDTGKTWLQNAAMTISYANGEVTAENLYRKVGENWSTETSSIPK